MREDTTNTVSGAGVSSTAEYLSSAERNRRGSENWMAIDVSNNGDHAGLMESGSSQSREWNRRRGTLAVNGSMRKEGDGQNWKYDKREGVFECVKYRKTYVRKSLYEKHTEACTTTKVEGHTLERALAMADHLINEERSIEWYTRHD